MPKGGGAIRGIGEKFSANPATGTGSFSVPVATTPGRGGFGPSLELSYDSGGGNGVFGLGWNLPIPSISRKTDRGLPRYDEREDTFVLAGFEDLVPDGEPVERGTVRVQRYRPRVEGAFSRIERWPNSDGTFHWQVRTGDNVLHTYGETSSGRVFEPGNELRTFSWLLERSEDDRGNFIVYEYEQEDDKGVLKNSPCEAGRFDPGGRFTAEAQRYLKRIRYGNQAPYEARDFHFEVVFDYGDHDEVAPAVQPDRPWPVRADPFSSFRSGFDIRTYRLCRRVLMFHRFEELGSEPCLVRSTDLCHQPDPAGSRLTSVTQRGYRRGLSGVDESAALPSLDFTYTSAEVHDRLEDLPKASLAGYPGADGGQWIDLNGEGIPGFLVATDGAWFYKANLGGGVLSAPRRLDSLPAPASLGPQQLSDLDGSGRLSLVSFGAPLPGFFERDGETWRPFRAFDAVPGIDWKDSNLRFIDLDGDGIADLLITQQDVFVWYRSKGKKGFEPAALVSKSPDERTGPAVVFADGTESIQLVDLSGDGLMDIVRVRNGEVCYWPNLGYGRFGARVVMSGSPVFASRDLFDPKRVRFADIDGTGPSDMLYLGGDGVSFWLNQSGNGWGERQTLRSVPTVDSHTRVSVADLLGSGTSCLVISSDLPGDRAHPIRYVDLLGSQKSNLLCKVTNNLGAETKIIYAPSTKFYLQDKAEGRSWLTRLSFPVHVVERVESLDHVTGTKLVTRYRYHHGFYDEFEREFRGFAFVEQWDAETFAGAAPLELPPVLVKSWFHTGAWLGREALEEAISREYYGGDPKAPRLPRTVLPPDLTAKEEREAARALRGKLLRQEIYAEDGTAASAHPYLVTERSYALQTFQPATYAEHGVFFPHDAETVELHYERNPVDPRIQHQLVLEVDRFGHPTRTAALGYPRRDHADDDDPQGKLWASVTESQLAWSPDDAPWLRHGVPIEESAWELIGLDVPDDEIVTAESLRAAIADAAEVAFDASPPPGTKALRRLSATRTRYLDEDLSPLAFGEISYHALPYDTYRLAFTKSLVERAFREEVDEIILTGEGGYVELDGMWWAPTGRLVYDPARFLQLVQATDPFGGVNHLSYDAFSLLVAETIDPAGNVTSVLNDYRVQAPWRILDPNENLTYFEFDALGLVVKTAQMGKGEGDTLSDPTTRFEYDLHRFVSQGKPAYARTLARETHGDPNTRWIESYSYSDGHGQEVMAKARAAPGLAPARGPDGALLHDSSSELVMPPTSNRWVGSGRTVFDNKGNPVKKYEPFFSSTHEYEDEAELVEWGVTPVLHYDPLGRLIETEQPNGTRARVVFDAWRQESWDENDAVLGTAWLIEREVPTADKQERRAAQRTLAHAGTPTVTHLDSLGRPFRTDEDNGGGAVYTTTLTLDIQGNQVEVKDAEDKTAALQVFDPLQRRIALHSCDAGMSWTFPDAADSPARSWDEREVFVRTSYDALRRPTHVWAREDVAPWLLAERLYYGETVIDAAVFNLRGQVAAHFDGAGLVAFERYDFKGGLELSTRRLAKSYTETADWSALSLVQGPLQAQGAVAALLETEAFSTENQYNALGRITHVHTPDQSISRFRYDQAGLLAGVDAKLRASSTWSPFVIELAHNARGQRERIVYANGTTTDSTYDPKTFRLKRLRTTRQSDGKVLQDLVYTHDPVGNITEIRDGAQQDLYFANEVVPANGLYRYDALYRLSEAKGREHAGQQPTHTDLPWSSLPHANDVQAMQRYEERYTYDKVGNILEMAHSAGGAGWTRRYEYDDESNRLLSTSLPSDPPNANSQRYAHDNAGNMVQMPHLAGMAWDWAGRLQVADKGGGGQVYFTYDSGGQRVRKVYEHSGVIEERIYLGSFELFRRRQSGTVQLERETLHLMDEKRRIAMVETKTRDGGMAVPTLTPRYRYQIDNHLGSAALELDDAGQIISYEEYFPYGSTAFRALKSGVDVSDKRYRYTGMERDEETSLLYNNARYAVSWLGRWLSPDPEGYVDGIDLYVYLRNSPFRFVDPHGTLTTDTQLGAGLEAKDDTTDTQLGAGLETKDEWKKTIETEDKATEVALENLRTDPRTREMMRLVEGKMKLEVVIKRLNEGDLGYEDLVNARGAFMSINDDGKFEVTYNQDLIEKLRALDGVPQEYTLEQILAHEIGHAQGFFKAMEGFFDMSEKGYLEAAYEMTEKQFRLATREGNKQATANENLLRMPMSGPNGEWPKHREGTFSVLPFSYLTFSVRDRPLFGAW
ncbi:SpvB/TcaC N-terminal domain-containing protein [Vulgatibacter incomptus]|nr:SpvB/TcaC N-terminal domain-containing protein [Vulgatibacter incomptus]